MRILLIAAPIVFALAGCNAADRTADDVGNAAASAGSAIENGASDAANTAEAAVTSVGNGLEDARNEIAGASPEDWVGRWTGVEGTYLVISKEKTPGRYQLEMQYTLDDKGKFAGTETNGTIRFDRPDGKQTLKASDGDATGLKYLAGKKDCLKVKDGEGYCRD